MNAIGNDANHVRRILHVDMDAFYASVEERDQPRLKGRPVVVGGTPQGRGVVAAANYLARKFGVHSAMPAAQARRLCPHAEFVRPRMAHYVAISQSIREILRRFTPVVEPLALDEAFMDVTASERLFGPAPQLGEKIRSAIREELGLTASVGVAGNKFLAKLACTLAKPDGLRVVADNAVQHFLDPLPVSRLWGVGDVARATLAREGIDTVMALRCSDPNRLRALFGVWGERLMELARGEDLRPVVCDARAKSISHETTFSRDIDDLGVLRAWAFELGEQVAQRARNDDITARTVRLKLRYADFRTVTRARSLDHPINDTQRVCSTAVAMLERELAQKPGALRLLGVGLAGFDEQSAAQIDLFSERRCADSIQIDEVTDRITRRFGRGSVSRARTLGK